MPIDLILKPSCGACGSTADLYGSACRHLTLCVTCGKSMADKLSKCCECGTPITRLIREYNIRTCFSDDKNYFIATGLPSFRKNDDQWSIQKESLKGRQVTDALRFCCLGEVQELEDGSGQLQYRGHLEGTEATTYYLLMRKRKELIAFPAGSWYSFNKVPQYKQLTLEEAEVKMEGRRLAAIGYEKRMMDAAHSGAAAFGKFEKPENREGAAGGGRKRKRTTEDDDGESNASNSGEGDEEEEVERISRLGINRSSGDAGDEEGFQGGDFDDDVDEDHDIQQGDWEYEEIFSDDDEAIGVPEEMAMENEPPEIKQDDDEADEEWGLEGLSISGKELKKLLGRALNDYNPEHVHVKDDTKDDISRKEAPKETPVDNSNPLKAKTSAAGLKKPSKKSSKGIKYSREESRTPKGAHLKKVKTENCRITPSPKSDSYRRIRTPV